MAGKTDTARGESAPPVMQPLVTVVLVCFNHEQFVEQALRSILNQSYPNIELVVTDDASSDDSLATIKRLLDDAPWPTRLVANATNHGLCATLNKALSRVSGESFVDLITGCSFATPSMMYRRSALAEVGPYDETLPAEDFDMLLRLARRTRFFFLPERLTNWRSNPESMSRQAGRIGRFEYCLPSLAKHFGVSDDYDQMIAERMSTMAVAVYIGGGSRPLAAKYLRLAALKHPHKRAIAFAVPSGFGVPGTMVDRGIHILRSFATRGTNR